jgi:hypothetical protein
MFCWARKGGFHLRHLWSTWHDFDWGEVERRCYRCGTTRVKRLPRYGWPGE